MNTGNDDVDEHNDEFTRTSSLSVKTKAGYVQVYKTFMDWKAKRSAESFSEDLILDYFKEKSITNLPSTLGAIYYMLKFTLLANNDVDITSYSKLRSYLRKTRGGYRSTPTKVFTANEVDSFLRFAPDRSFLDLKVIVILAVFGDMSTEDLKNLSMGDVEVYENLMFVKIPSSKTVPSRSFVITDFQYSIVKSYLDLRPKNFDSRILLLTYRDGRCFNQPMGKNNMKAMPTRMAQFLSLANPDRYTGQCFKETSKILLGRTNTEQLK